MPAPCGIRDDDADLKERQLERAFLRRCRPTWAQRVNHAMGIAPSMDSSMGFVLHALMVEDG